MLVGSPASASVSHRALRLLAVLLAVALGAVPTLAFAAPSSALATVQVSAEQAEPSYTVDAPETVFTGDEFSIVVRGPVDAGISWSYGAMDLVSATTNAEGDTRVSTFRFRARTAVETQTVRFSSTEWVHESSVDIVRRPTSIVLNVPSTFDASSSLIWSSTMSWSDRVRVPSGDLTVRFASDRWTLPVSSAMTFAGHPGPGTHIISVDYPGDDYFEAFSASTTAVGVKLVPTVTVRLSPESPEPGDLVTATATVTSPDTRTWAYDQDVSFTLPDGTVVSVPTTWVGSRVSTASTTFVAELGTQAVSAATQETPYFAPASGQASAEVGIASTTLVLDVPAGDTLSERTVTVTATSSGSSLTATGQVTLVAGSTPLATVDLVDGVGTWTGRLPAGSYDVVASYPGDSRTGPTTAAVPVVVEKVVPAVDVVAPAQLTPGDAWTVEIDVREEVPEAGALAVPASSTQRARSAVAAAPAGGAVVLAAPVVGTGAVRVLLDGVAMSSTSLVDGRATVVVDSSGWTLSPGTHTLSVVYDGDANFAPRTVDAVLEVAAAPVVVPPVVVPPVVTPPLVTPPLGETPVGQVPAVPAVPVPGVAQPAALPVPAAAASPSADAAPSRALAESGADPRLLLLLGPLLVAGATLLVARRSAGDRTA